MLGCQEELAGPVHEGYTRCSSVWIFPSGLPDSRCQCKSWSLCHSKVGSQISEKHDIFRNLLPSAKKGELDVVRRIREKADPGGELKVG
jgi:hypothetical protein